ncbi:MAG: hypothetical protein ABW036_00650 [Flavitalea sp.]
MIFLHVIDHLAAISCRLDKRVKVELKAWDGTLKVAEYLPIEQIHFN